VYNTNAHEKSVINKKIAYTDNIVLGIVIFKIWEFIKAFLEIS
jgi:hypothetical protein